MESFVKSTGYKRIEHLSTGISGFDTVLGECFTRGTSILLLEDENSQIHSTILKVFLSEGASNQENMMAVMKEGRNVEIYGTGSFTEKEDEDKMVIAWRYTKLSLARPLFKFNLSKKRRFEGILLSGEDATLKSILDIARKEKELRIAIFSLGSPVWKLSGLGEEEMAKFLFELKRAVRANGHVCMVSIPGFFMANTSLSLYFDTVGMFDSNMFSCFCPNYNGVLELRKIGGYGSLRVNTLGSLKYGVKIRKENISMEKIDMPPEDIKADSRACDMDKSF
ncbi:uncharacterized protein Eint_040780 [Encephalitozoon intestinalis ATCC 50506]|uniref:Elongator complex protein 4 n=1 Tax=Encephalitozoon intestinalis (strain ATCC 50506) TaxID=876142 RepID=E0S6N3_ENCIT|nr:uncharacterized protein Eint_040780 [Encephalitozoon intestinalis ATCC 50506]ADM11368.1 hypothetical protein Eint_040780 [Encephalitozoon intestinalis ATCC 50506]UTX45058.1 KaiC domain-containing protein [Encephalitozoon intestinalis]